MVVRATGGPVPRALPAIHGSIRLEGAGRSYVYEMGPLNSLPNGMATETPVQWRLRVGGLVLAFGIVLNVACGIAIVLFVWYPPALVTHIANPQYVDPTSMLTIWIPTAALLGALVGGVAGAITAVPIIALGKSRLSGSRWFLLLVPLISVAIVGSYMLAVGQLA